MSFKKKPEGALAKFLTVFGIIGATLAALAVVTKLAKNYFAKKDEEWKIDDDFWSEDKDESEYEEEEEEKPDYSEVEKLDKETKHIFWNMWVFHGLKPTVESYIQQAKHMKKAVASLNEFKAHEAEIDKGLATLESEDVKKELEELRKNNYKVVLTFFNLKKKASIALAEDELLETAKEVCDMFTEKEDEDPVDVNKLLGLKFRSDELGKEKAEELAKAFEEDGFENK